MQVEKPQDEVGVSYVRWGRTGRTGRRGTCPGVRAQFFFLRCTGSEFTILNSRTIVNQLMPWKHRPTSLQMFVANGQRLHKSGKVIVDSVDLKVVDAMTQSERTFRPTFEVADLRPSDELIIGMD